MRLLVIKVEGEVALLENVLRLACFAVFSPALHATLALVVIVELLYLAFVIVWRRLLRPLTILVARAAVALFHFAILLGLQHLVFRVRRFVSLLQLREVEVAERLRRLAVCSARILDGILEVFVQLLVDLTVKFLQRLEAVDRKRRA